MPDTGAPASSPPASHTATEQWQSFEVRMRRRRLDRCLLRAEVALDAGFPEDARESLAEARRLGAREEETAAIDARIAAAAASVPAADEPGAGRPAPWRRFALVGGLAVAAAAFALAGSLMRDSGEHAQPIPQATMPAADAVQPAPKPPASPQPTSGVSVRYVDIPVTERIVEAPPPAFDLRAETSRPEAPPAQPPSERADSVLRSDVQRAVDTPPQPPEPAPMAVPPPAQPAAPPSTTVSASVDPLPLSTPLPEPPEVARATAPAPLVERAAAPAPAPPPPVDESMRVRAALSRYEAAYSSLDAAAARAVWPTVDLRALSRAFDGLQSQRLSLGSCEVSIKGTAARAECAGSATWTPKVGGGGRTQARQWTFDLRNAAEGWQILRADVR